MKRFAVIALALMLLAGCEGLFTGTKEIDQPLTQAADGSFAPAKVQLTPDMNPLAFNFHGETIPNLAESTRWNSYRATLTFAGSAVASGSFDINNPGAREQEHGGPFAQTMFYVSVPQAGEYELTIVPVRPKEITIENPRLKVRRNVQPPPR
jgi:hypothetical protein